MLQSSAGSAKPTSSPTMTAAIKKPNRNSFIVNFIAGGIGGTTGVFLTCPLDVVQTRLQSSFVKLNPVGLSSAAAAGTSTVNTVNSKFGMLVYSYMRHMVKTEGFFSLYKGLVPNLMGIAPSRAVYFGVYTKSKAYFSSTHLSNSSWTHMLSALTASWTVSTLTNPIWFLKTKFQLDLNTTGQRPTLLSLAKDTLKNEGIRGFYRGLSASYIGASETMIYFVIYEHLKLVLGANEDSSNLSPLDYICASFLAKSAATVSVYPHEVVRTRLRQESVKVQKDKIYKGFKQTLLKVYKDEKWTGLYGGMGAHLMRQVPNTVIMFLTYETIVKLISKD